MIIQDPKQWLDIGHVKNGKLKKKIKNMKKSELRKLIKKTISEQMGTAGPRPLAPPSSNMASDMTMSSGPNTGSQITSVNQALQMAMQEGAPSDVINDLRALAQSRSPQSSSMIAKRLISSSKPRPGTPKKPFWSTIFGQLLFRFLSALAGAAGSAIGGAIPENK